MAATAGLQTGAAMRSEIGAKGCSRLTAREWPASASKEAARRSGWTMCARAVQRADGIAAGTPRRCGPLMGGRATSPRARRASTKSGSAMRTACCQRRGVFADPACTRSPRSIAGRIDAGGAPYAAATQHAGIWLLPLAGGTARRRVTSPSTTRRPISTDSTMLAVQRPERALGNNIVRLRDSRRVVISTSGREHPRGRAAALTSSRAAR